MGERSFLTVPQPRSRLAGERPPWAVGGSGSPQTRAGRDGPFGVPRPRMAGYTSKSQETASSAVKGGLGELVVLPSRIKLAVMES